MERASEEVCVPCSRSGTGGVGRKNLDERYAITRGSTLVLTKKWEGRGRRTGKNIKHK